MQYAFYRIPKRPISGDEFQNADTEEKLLYGLMPDRLKDIGGQALESLKNLNNSEKHVPVTQCLWLC